jgi:hypothetical protein
MAYKVKEFVAGAALILAGIVAFVSILAFITVAANLPVNH